MAEITSMSAIASTKRCVHSVGNHLLAINKSYKSLTADASGITAITLTANEYAALGVGQASVQVSATDLAGNVSMLAFTDFKVL